MKIINPPVMRGYSLIGLVNPKKFVNIGSILRAVGCYGSSAVFYTGIRYKPSPTDAFKQYRHTPIIKVDDLKNVIPLDCIPVAVDLVKDADPLHTYQHPRSAFYIFGPEDSTLGKDIIEWCRDLVYVPTNRCMNLAAAVNVVLYDRLAKQLAAKSSF